MSVIVPFPPTMQMALQSDASEGDVSDPRTSNVFWQSAPSVPVQRASQEITSSRSCPQSISLGLPSRSRISSVTKFRATGRDGGPVSAPWEESPAAAGDESD
jgi:hypothetical protein